MEVELLAVHGRQSLTKPDTVVDAPGVHRVARRSRGFLLVAALLSLIGLLLLAPSSFTSLLLPVHSAPAHHPLLQAQQTTPALVSAAGGAVPLGGISVTLAVSVSNVVELGAITGEVGYDNSVVAPVLCRPNRAAFPTAMCNLAYDSDNDGTRDSVRFTLLTDLQSSVSAPANAPVIMVDIAWIATGTAVAGMTTPLSVTVSTFAAASGVAAPFTTRNGQIVITDAPPPTSTPLPTATPMATATPAVTPTVASPTPTSAERAAIFLPMVALP
ncbi:MAG: hypothetical protein ACK47M_14360 [Caldilinea sp.]